MKHHFYYNNCNDSSTVPLHVLSYQMSVITQGAASPTHTTTMNIMSTDTALNYSTPHCQHHTAKHPHLLYQPYQTVSVPNNTYCTIFQYQLSQPTPHTIPNTHTSHSQQLEPHPLNNNTALNVKTNSHLITWSIKYIADIFIRYFMRAIKINVFGPNCHHLIVREHGNGSQNKEVRQALIGVSFN